jgi:hypothetical protein
MEGDVTDEGICRKCSAPVQAGLIFCKSCGASVKTPAPLVTPTSHLPRTHVPIFADAIALILIAIQLAALLWWLLPDDGTLFITGVVAYGVLVVAALAMWYGKEAEKFSDAYESIKLFFGSVLLGCLSFAVDIIVGSFEYPDVSPIRAGTKVGSPLGFILTVFLCPGISMIAVASIFRSAFASVE